MCRVEVSLLYWRVPREGACPSIRVEKPQMTFFKSINFRLVSLQAIRMDADRRESTAIVREKYLLNVGNFLREVKLDNKML